MKTLLFKAAFIAAVIVGVANGKENGGLIFSGLDTLWTIRFPSFDFVSQTPCSTISDYSGCYCHIYFLGERSVNLWYDLGINVTEGLVSEYSMPMGKINLDSVKFAPPDSILYQEPIGKIDSIPPDSLSSRIGNVYVFKTGTDPRPAWNMPFYAKIKILNLIVVDSASHSVKMAFLWAYNNSGTTDLRTSGLDTFHLDTVPTAIRSSSLASPRNANSANPQSIFKVAGDFFNVPANLIGLKSHASVFDLSGRKLAEIPLGTSKILDLRRYGFSKGVLLVRIEGY